MNQFSSSIKIMFICLFVSGITLAQESSSQFTPKRTSVVVDSISSILKSRYVFPEVADKMVAKVQNKVSTGAYSSFTDPQQLVAQLTKDLQAISHDKHLRVMYNPERVAAEQKVITKADSIAFLTSRVARMQQRNFGFNEVKLLDGNIGYLDLRAFMEVSHAGPTAVAAMNFLSNADAIIIDLRQNGGGSPQMIQLITSYLYDSEPVHLNNFYWRPSDRNTQTWTLPHVSGKRNPDADIYILTSGYTFSAAEEFTYNLKNLKRATIIGETTGGGAHPGGVVNAIDGFMVWTPSGRAINPITKTNWEGTGVIPHIKVSSKEALDVAQITALEKLMKKHKTPEKTFMYNWSISTLKTLLKPATVSKSTLKSYVGVYDQRKVTYENKSLYYQRGEGNKHRLIPVNQKEFMLEGMTDFRVQFETKNNKVVAIKGLYDNGRTDINMKVK